MDNWFDSMHGGTHYVGKCQICKEPNGACSDDICTDCLEMIPIECPTCGRHYHRSQFGDSGQKMLKKNGIIGYIFITQQFKGVESGSEKFNHKIK